MTRRTAPFALCAAGARCGLDAPDCEIRVLIRGNGKGMARFWTCDLTEDHIRINASYRT